MTPTPTFRPSAETVRLTRRFMELKPDEVITYQEVQQLIGFDPQGPKGRPITAAAREAVRRESQIVVVCMAKHGFKRALSHEAIDIGNAKVREIRRKAKKALEISSCPPPEDLDQDQRIGQLKVQSQLGAIYAMTTTKVANQIENTVSQSKRILEFNAAAIAAFTK